MSRVLENGSCGGPILLGSAYHGAVRAEGGVSASGGLLGQLDALGAGVTAASRCHSTTKFGAEPAAGRGGDHSTSWHAKLHREFCVKPGDHSPKSSILSACFLFRVAAGPRVTHKISNQHSPGGSRGGGNERGQAQAHLLSAAHRGRRRRAQGGMQASVRPIQQTPALPLERSSAARRPHSLLRSRHRSLCQMRPKEHLG
jgi:hypothetical protein